MTVYELDNANYYMDFTELTEDNKDVLNYTIVPMTIGYYKPKFNHDIQDWEEGATLEEIEEIKLQEENRPPNEPDKMEVLQQQLKQQESAIGLLATQIAKNTLLQNGGIK